MKIRNGFVSNSSSSSFILKGKITSNYFLNDMKNIWQELLDNKDEDVSPIVDFHSNVFSIDVKGYEKRDAATIISAMYKEQCWGDGNHPINAHYYYGRNLFKKFLSFIIKKLSKTYLQEALEADVFITANENYVPYPVLDALLEKYGKDLTIHHLG